MQDTETLSRFHEANTQPSPALPGAALVFDACHVGVVLRAVLFVELAVLVGAQFGVHRFDAWLAQAGLVTGAALPATLAWLLGACVAKRLLARLAPGLQYAVAMVFGALAALYGCGILYVAGLVLELPWVASASSGALLSAVLVAGLVLRAKGRTPADTKARLTELQARIRPHFLFNTLNSAIALVRAEPAKAEALLEDLSDLFRHALKDQQSATTLGEEIELAQRYLAIEQVRFGERLQVRWTLDPEANAAKLPPLLLQPLVENAVRHGVEPSPTGAAIEVSTERRGSVVVVKVNNTVPGGPGMPGQGLALRNVSERLHLMHDVQGMLRCGLRGGSYRVRLEVPL